MSTSLSAFILVYCDLNWKCTVRQHVIASITSINTNGKGIVENLVVYVCSPAVTPWVSELSPVTAGGVAVLRRQRINMVGAGDVFGMPRRGKQTHHYAL